MIEKQIKLLNKKHQVSYKKLRAYFCCRLKHDTKYHQDNIITKHYEFIKYILC